MGSLFLSRDAIAFHVIALRSDANVPIARAAAEPDDDVALSALALLVVVAALSTRWLRRRSR